MNILEKLKININILYTKYLRENDNENTTIYYIGGSQSLPEPLNQEEEAKLLKKLSQGEEQAKKTLVEKNLRLVVYIAKKFENTGIGIEDLISIGTIRINESHK